MATSFPGGLDNPALPDFTGVLGNPARSAGAFLTDLRDAVAAAQAGVGTTTTPGTLPLVRKGALVVNVRDYGATGDGTTDDTSAVAAAKAVLTAGGTLRFPRGTYKLTGDLTLTVDGVSVHGDGEGSHLAFVGAGLVVDGQSGYRLRNTLSGLRISRTGTAGPALYFKGGGATTGAARFNVHDVHVSASTGTALKVAGSYTGAFTGCYFRGSAIGVEVAADPVGGTVFGNLLTFVGGEIQGNAVGATITSPAGVNFFGVGIEGNTTSGLEVPSNPRNVGLYGCFFEANAGWDVKLGTSTPTGYGLVVKGCYFSDAAVGKTAAVILVRGYAVAVEECSFLGYGANSPVSVQEASAGGVRGFARNNATNGSAAIVSLGGATLFGGSYLGDDTSTPVKRHLTASASLDFASLVAGASTTLTVTVTGAIVGDDATAHANSLPEAGLVFQATVTAADTVTVRCTNASTATIDPAARTWRVRVWR